MGEDRLRIDFTDPADIRDKLPRAWDRLDSANAAFHDARRELEFWTSLIRVLSERVGVDPAADPRQPTGEAARAEDEEDVGGDPVAAGSEVRQHGSASVLDLAVEVVKRETRKIRSKDVMQILHSEGHEVTADQVSNALYYAAVTARPPRIKRAPGRGFYAPLEYEEEGAIQGWDPQAAQVRGDPAGIFATD